MDEGEDVDDPGMDDDDYPLQEVIAVTVEEETVQKEQMVDDVPKYVLIGDDGTATVLNSIPVIGVPTTSADCEAERVKETNAISESSNERDKEENDKVYFLNYRLVLAQPDQNVDSTKVLTLKDYSNNEFNKEVQKTAKSPQKSSRSYKCTEPGCERSFSSLQRLKVHSASHRWRRGYPCTVSGCNKVFSSQYGRKAHVRVHTGERPYKCVYDFCGKAFNTSGDLQKHVRIHTGERPFKCKVEGCNKAFTTGNILQIHVRSHTGERPFVCDSPGCNRKFASSTNYKNHMRIHSGEKPFSCKVEGCGKRFTEYSSLYKHNAVHNQMAKMPCPLCNKSYRQQASLTTHMKTAHNGATIIARTVSSTADSVDYGNSSIQVLTGLNEEQEESPFYIVNSDYYYCPKIEFVEFGGLELKDTLSAE